MKIKLGCILIALLFTSPMAMAEPVRVVLLAFADETGMTSDEALGGTIDTKALAAKGIYLTSQRMLAKADFSIVDRRDFLVQMKKIKQNDEGAPTSTRPSQLDAARALNADVLLRGSLISFSTGKEKIDQGGYQADFSKVSLSVALQAQDVIDGAVIASSVASAKQSFRQTAARKRVLNEDDILGLMGIALDQAISQVTADINKKMAVLQSRKKVTLSVTSTDDPAMVEIDGVLVGTTPIHDLKVYLGDHVFHISRPGYESITKRISLSKSAKIMVPMLRTDLTAEEKKQILESADLRAYILDGKPDLVIQTIE